MQWNNYEFIITVRVDVLNDNEYIDKHIKYGKRKRDNNIENTKKTLWVKICWHEWEKVKNSKYHSKASIN